MRKIASTPSGVPEPNNPVASTGIGRTPALSGAAFERARARHQARLALRGAGAVGQTPARRPLNYMEKLEASTPLPSFDEEIGEKSAQEMGDH